MDVIGCIFTYKEYDILNIWGKMYVPFIRVVYFIRPPQLARPFSNKQENYSLDKRNTILDIRAISHASKSCNYVKIIPRDMHVKK